MPQLIIVPETTGVTVTASILTSTGGVDLEAWTTKSTVLYIDHHRGEGVCRAMEVERVGDEGSNWKAEEDGKSVKLLTKSVPLVERFLDRTVGYNMQ